ncbi:S-layer homology domain-containing protein [Jeotgalibacillus salarius]|uniref:MBL fold metallo-hydrolase n=1 Tax=Jeotgalibacillus salarius TaxID=546023 RepID=A0A4Y8LN77_9BACL|nr:S-layer homology domain-containing protein [Jeotgalibacillus salarius]TFE04040.1 MBL fold metallo-hydrolase [Jeotgalibacillus salarius]
MKKLFISTVTASLLLSAPLSADAAFSDVSMYEDEIDFLTGEGIIKGYDNGTFRPGNALNRLQAVQMILREMGIEDIQENEVLDPGFTDLRPGNYGYNEVAKAVELGFIGGKTAENGTRFFDAYGTLTRAQMAKIMAEGYDLSSGKDYSFSDVASGHWANDHISRIANAGVTTGYQDGSFKPENKLQRQHFALFMARLLNESFRDHSGSGQIGELGEIAVTFLDVGQGDAILIEHTNGEVTLVGAGRYGSVTEAALQAEGVTRIDTLIITHPDADHVGGAADVIRNYDVKEVFDSGQVHTTQVFEDYLDAIEDTGVFYSDVRVGDELSDDERTDLAAIAVDPEASDMNEGSIVLKLTHGEMDFMLTGDAGIEVEEELIATGVELESEVLKVSHHGSNTGTSVAFLAAVDPDYAVLSFGDNPYGHPHDEVVQRLAEYPTDIYATEDGSVIFTSNGDALTVENGKQYTAPDQPQDPDPMPGDDGQLSDKLRITGKNLDTEVVTVKNEGTIDVSMKDWKLVSVEGNQTYTFPDDYVLTAGASVQIVSGNGASAGTDRLLWTGSYIWNNDGDAAQLVDPEGNIVYQLD